MRVLAFDPFVTEDAARKAGAEPAELDALLAASDYVTLHCPLTETTHHLLDAAKLALMKKGAHLINCARGGLVDEAALHEALTSGHLAGAALDVFETEPPEGSPLLLLENVVATPHLGASTSEAQTAVSLAIVQQVAAFLERGEIAGAVNLPAMASADALRLAPWQDLARHLGRVLSALAPWAIERLDVGLFGQVSSLDARPIVSEALVGVLRSRVTGPVNRVNAARLAARQGLAFVESRSDTSDDYVSLLTLTAKGGSSTVSLAGTLLGERMPRLVRVDDFRIEIAPEGCLVVTLHEDKPGVVGALGTLLGRAGVNISRMQIGLSEKRPEAMAVLGIDCALEPATLGALKELPAMRQVWYVPA
jgi:D-3-phosphoglycerate dehydrogenase / 2-oxoglutarate reductase